MTDNWTGIYCHQMYDRLTTLGLHGFQSSRPLEPLGTILPRCSGGFRRVPMMPRGARLSGDALLFVVKILDVEIKFLSTKLLRLNLQSKFVWIYDQNSFKFAIKIRLNFRSKFVWICDQNSFKFAIKISFESTIKIRFQFLSFLVITENSFSKSY